MKLPNREKAFVPREKIVDYLLSFVHKDGRAKAEFFTRFGFASESWEVLPTRSKAAPPLRMSKKRKPLRLKCVILLKVNSLRRTDSNHPFALCGLSNQTRTCRGLPRRIRLEEKAND